jgi:hypothetical protein
MMSPRNTVSVNVGPLALRSPVPVKLVVSPPATHLDSMQSLGLIGVSDMQSLDVGITDGVTYGSGGRFDQTKP